MRQIIIDKGIFLTRVGILEDGKLADYRLEIEHSRTQVGKIFKGRVEDVLPGMDAAFVDIGLEKNAYLSKMDIVKNGRRGRRETPLGDLIKTGDEVLVEVVKDPSGNKGAKVSMRISLNGRGMVLMPEDGHVGISRKIHEDSERLRLENWVEQMDLEDHGLILRTSAADMDRSELTEELNSLKSQWEDIKRYRVLGRSPQCVYGGAGFLQSVLHDELHQNIEAIYCNSPEVFESLAHDCARLCPEWTDRLRLHRDQVPIFDSFGVEKALSDMTARKIELPGGGHIVVDETEAMTVIDVNSGQQTGRRSMNETAFKVNLQAVELASRLVKIREISGIILLDCIDMFDGQLQNELVRRAEKAFRADRNRVTVHGLTKLGLLELTRKKSVDALSMKLEEECPRCAGTGYVDSAVGQAEKILGSARYHAHHTDERCFLYRASKGAREFLQAHQSRVRETLSDIGIKLLVVDDDDRSMERIGAGSEEKMMKNAKIAGYLTVYHI